MKAKQFVILTVLVGLSSYGMRLFVFDPTWRKFLTLEIFNVQTVLFAIFLFKQFNDEYWRVFCSWLILWRVANCFIIYINYDDYFPEGLAHTLAYTELLLFVLSILHLGLKKWVSSMHSSS